MTEYYRFKYRDPPTGKWVTARYPAEKATIAKRYAEFELLGPPEIRSDEGGNVEPFSPFKEKR